MIQRLRSIICKNKVLCEGIVGFLISVALWLMFGIIRSKEFLLAGLLMAFVYVVLHFGLKYANSRRMKFALILAIPFSFCFELGQLVTYGESESPGVSVHIKKMSSMCVSRSSLILCKFPQLTLRTPDMYI